MTHLHLLPLTPTTIGARFGSRSETRVPAAQDRFSFLSLLDASVVPLAAMENIFL